MINSGGREVKQITYKEGTLRMALDLHQPQQKRKDNGIISEKFRVKIISKLAFHPQSMKSKVE